MCGALFLVPWELVGGAITSMQGIGLTDSLVVLKEWSVFLGTEGESILCLSKTKQKQNHLNGF